MKYFQNKKVLITGASKGIGKACALRFGEDGANVIVHYNTGRQDAEDTLQKVIISGGTGKIIGGNLGDLDSIAKIWDESCEGGIIPDTLILNAAFQKKLLPGETTPELLESTLRINIVGNFALSMSFIAACQKINKKGTIVVHSSNQSEFVNPTGFAYAISKAGLNHMVKHLARSVAGANIRVNGILLGWFDTEGERKFYPAEQIRKQASETIPMARIGEPKEAAEMSYFLASELSSYMTGSLVRFDGGFALNPDLST